MRPRRDKVRIGEYCLRVLSRQLIETYDDEDCLHCVISIRNMNTPIPKFSEKVFTRVDTLLLECSDVEDSTLEGQVSKYDGHAIQTFSRDDASKILAFVAKYVRQDIHTFYIHCEAGISRSAGVAAALGMIIEKNGDEYFFKNYLPNRLVYRTILKEWFITGKYLI